jgi:hypothetical protein
MLYFPPHLKYVELDVDPEQTGLSRPLHVRTRARTDEWHTSVVLAWVVLGHLCVSPLRHCSAPVAETLLQWFLHLHHGLSHRDRHARAAFDVGDVPRTLVRNHRRTPTSAPVRAGC